MSIKFTFDLEQYLYSNAFKGKGELYFKSKKRLFLINRINLVCPFITI